MTGLIKRSAFFAMWGVLIVFPPLSIAGTSGPSNSGASASPSGLGNGIPDEVLLTSGQMKSRTIRVEKAVAGVVKSKVTAPATAEFLPERVSRVGPRVPAVVIRLVKKVGDRVKAGDVIAVLDSIELGKAKARYLALRSRLEVARKTFDREQNLVAKNISSQADLQQARADYKVALAERDSSFEELRLYGLSSTDIESISADRRTLFSRYELTASQQGIIEQFDITPGLPLTPATPLIKIVDPGHMRILAQVAESDANRIDVGASIRFHPGAMPGQVFDGTVQSVGASLSPRTRRLEVRATVPNPDNTLRAGMFGSAQIQSNDSAQHTLVPLAAVQPLNKAQILFKPVPGKVGQYAVAVVKTGAESGQQIEILDGLAPGEPVVTEGSFALMSILTSSTRQDTD